MGKKTSVNGEIYPNKSEVALKLSPLVGMNVMLNSEEGVSVTSIGSIKVVSTPEEPIILVLYTGMGLVTISNNKKMKEILVINDKGQARTLYSLVSDVLYF